MVILQLLSTEYTMKKIVFYVIFTLFSVSLLAQDLLITTNNDSILCKVVLIDVGVVKYEVPTKNGAKTLEIALEDVQDFKYNHYTPQSNPTPTIRNKPEQEINKRIETASDNKKDFNRLILQASVGVSYRYATLSGNNTTDRINLFNQLRTGIGAKASVTYRWREYIGVGIEGSVNTSEANGDLQGVNTTINTEISEITLFYYRQFSQSETHHWYATFGLGSITYKENLTTSTISESYEEYTGSAKSAIGYVYVFSPRLKIDLSIDILSANIELYSNSTTGYSNIDLSRIGLNIGIQF